MYVHTYSRNIHMYNYTMNNVSIEEKLTCVNAAIIIYGPVSCTCIHSTYCIILLYLRTCISAEIIAGWKKVVKRCGSYGLALHTMCIYVHVHVRMCTCTCTYMYIHNIHKYMYSRKWMQVSIFKWVYIILAYMGIYTVRTCTCTCIYMDLWNTM